MNFSAKYSYAKPTGISLLLHGALIGLFLLFGVCAPSVALPAETVAIEVDILPAVVVDMRDTAPVPAVPSFSTDLADKPVPTRAPAAGDFESLSPAMPGGTSVVKPASLGLESGMLETAAVGGKARGGGGQTAASCLYGPKPAYPQAARKAKWEGAVVVHVLIDVDGTVTAVSVREGSDYDALNEAALRTLKQWRFSPATTGGMPVASVRDIRVRFRLDDEQ